MKRTLFNILLVAFLSTSMPLSILIKVIVCLLPFLPGAIQRKKMMSYNHPEVTSSLKRHAQRILTNLSDNPLRYIPEPKQKPFTEMNVTERVRFVNRQCELGVRVGQIHVNKKSNVYVFVDHEHKILACSNLKAASSTVASIFYRLLNISSTWVKYRRNYLQKRITASTFNSLDYVKFMVVREPIEKLMSVYKEYWAHPKINGTKRPFPMFMSDVALYVNYTNDQHYMSTVERCLPCDVGYTYIATTDTLEQDMKPILSSINFTMDAIPVLNSKNTQTHRNFLRRELSNATIKDIWSRYAQDYQIFGFPYSLT